MPEVFFSRLQPKTSWPTADRAPRSTEEKTLGTQGSTGADSYKIKLGRSAMTATNKGHSWLFSFPCSILMTILTLCSEIVLVNLDGSFLLTVQQSLYKW